MTGSVKLKEVAKTVLTKCLQLPSGAEIVIFADETTLDIGTLLAEEAQLLNLKPVIAYFSIAMQISQRNDDLPPAFEAMLNDAAATMICLNVSPECLPFRRNIRTTAWNAGCKVAHMPGISLDTLLLADVDYDELSAQCEGLALALAKGEKIEIRTWDHRGSKHILKVPLQPWMRFPIVSDGIIGRDSWGNVPSGETYIAPPEGLTEGSIVVDGSIPGYLLGPDEEIIFHFKAGSLVDWEPRDSPPALHLWRAQIGFAQSKDDPYWGNLAEIGFGTNPLVEKLTGNPLLDEKKWGSIHIALGSNKDMGGEISSKIHCDMVSLSPEVFVDDKMILKDGNIVLAVEDWYEHYRNIQLPTDWNDALLIKRRVTNVYIDQQSRLRRQWDTSSGKVCSVPVGEDETAQLAAKIYRLVEETGHPIAIWALAKKAGIDLLTLRQVTYLLKCYGLVNAEPWPTS